MKLLKIFVFLMVTWSTYSVAVIRGEDFRFVDRYTDLTPTEPNPDKHKARRESGILYADGTGFVVSSSNDYELYIFGITPDVLSAIAGQFVEKESDWVFDQQLKINLSKFTRSAVTYPIDGVPYIITNLSGVSGGTSNIPAVDVPKVTFSATDNVASETGDDTAQYIINFNAPAKKNIKIKFKLEGNAQKGKDYERMPGSIVIPAGNMQGIIEIIPINDTKKEGVEKVVIKLDQDIAKRYKLQGRKSAVIKIIDND